MTPSSLPKTQPGTWDIKHRRWTWGEASERGWERRVCMWGTRRGREGRRERERGGGGGKEGEGSGKQSGWEEEGGGRYSFLNLLQGHGVGFLECLIFILYSIQLLYDLCRSLLFSAHWRSRSQLPLISSMLTLEWRSSSLSQDEYQLRWTQGTDSDKPWCPNTSVAMPRVSTKEKSI